jgi:hypothetical protein
MNYAPKIKPKPAFDDTMAFSGVLLMAYSIIFHFILRHVHPYLCYSRILPDKPRIERVSRSILHKRNAYSNTLWRVAQGTPGPDLRAFGIWSIFRQMEINVASD